jgi:exodeoxyribonuclease VII large subunit
MLESNHPKFKIKKGFAQISKEKKVIELSELQMNDEFELQSDTVRICAKVMKKENI